MRRVEGRVEACRPRTRRATAPAGPQVRRVDEGHGAAQGPQAVGVAARAELRPLALGRRGRQEAVEVPRGAAPEDAVRAPVEYPGGVLLSAELVQFI